MNPKPHITLPIADLSLHLQSWLKSIAQQYELNDHSLVHHAAALVQLMGAETKTPTGLSCLQQALHIAQILSELHVDRETLAAGLAYSCVRYAGLNLEDISEQLTPAVAKLISGVKKMDAIQSFHEQIGRARSNNAIDNIRKMLLAMVDDVRIVLIKLAERLAILRHMQALPEKDKLREAKITQDIYAPLANRLGIGHLKWELEDLSFRYLDPEKFTYISETLKSTRNEREIYVKKVINLLETVVKSLGITEVEVDGRAKHIYSIYKKMLRKNVDLDEIYDVIAFRILLPTIEDCYTVLGYVHDKWAPIPKEFDDYIAQPKPNGYKSIHTAVIGPDERVMEVQIRTFEMHQIAELGVAAHWVYKEGKAIKTGYEAKIAWLRQVMDWQKEITQATEPSEQDYSQVFDDHVYIFTPGGDVLELAKGATPLDFAYHIHTDVGHRCRGAKINGHIVPLTYQLKTGECVEILTTKEEHPSRDWLNPNLGYLKTPRARAKVHHWFRQLNHEKHLGDGEVMVDKELRRLGEKALNIDKLVAHLKFSNANELYSAVGRGDISISSLVHTIQEITHPAEAAADHVPEIHLPIKAPATLTDIEVQGVGNLLTHTALCCKPIPGDAVIGYVTQGHGVSIHRQDCSNILHISTQQKDRLIQVSWGTKTKSKYVVDLQVNAYDRQGLMNDITQLLVSERISILNLNGKLNNRENVAHIHLTIEIDGLNPLSRILARLQQVPNVMEVKRV